MLPVLYFERAWVFTLGLAAAGTLVAAGPCDIYASGGTPCIAAHSTTRALYSAYSGRLYQVKRDSDGKTTDISPLLAGRVANAAAQDSFYANTTCLIAIIYNQSGRSNHLTQAPPGGFKGPKANGYDNLASAIGAPITFNGKKAYGVFISPGTGYRNDTASSTAIGDATEGIYGIMADLENGLFSGVNPKKNTGDLSISYRFTTAAIKGRPNQWAIRGANAASTSSMSTFYSGVRPSNGYNPMRKEGAIILGIAGDNSISAQGTFYEGAMTSGYPSDATENAVQADIAAAKYATTPLTSGPALTIGSSISLRVTTSGYTDRYIAHNSSNGIVTEAVSSSSSTTLKQQATWIVRSALNGSGGNSGCVSLESRDVAGRYMRHYNFVLQLAADDGTKQMRKDATFCPQAPLNGQGNHSIRAWNYPTRYLRHYANVAYMASNGGVHAFDAAASFTEDVSFAVGAGFA
ncbi:fungal alpha-L-arabinofuranosidase [Chaetomium strumarium]|uniref:Alpha-L-arabinofuranosidase n=1 Tax=Chaetomium strumarium TaxID=1170767 RepID=A0AAJ0M3K4_9PEZI|nr:fungal alpha-L-arabinofuranosidase [Chaetomium strumarium]